MNESNILLYETDKGKIKIDVILKDETIWLTQKSMADLFECGSDNISLHLKNIFQENELDKKSTTEKISVVRKEGNRNVNRETREFVSIVYDLVNDPTVQRMKIYKQHCDTSCFTHCVEASYHCFKICKMMGFDYVSAARGAMLHDLFLYDWRRKSDVNSWHAFTHGQVAYDNASKIFTLNNVEKDMIINHMWPLTIKLPKTKEGWVLVLVDKYCAIKEFVRYYVFRLLGNN